MTVLMKEYFSLAKLCLFGAHRDTECVVSVTNIILSSHGFYRLFSQGSTKFDYNKANVLFIDARVISIVQWKTPNVSQKGLNWL